MTLEHLLQYVGYQIGLEVDGEYTSAILEEDKGKLALRWVPNSSGGEKTEAIIIPLTEHDATLIRSRGYPVLHSRLRIAVEGGLRKL